MNRREALRKATVDTSMVGAGLLTAEQSDAFIRTIKEKNPWGEGIRTLRRRASTGEINKLATANRIIREAKELEDDGYRVGATFPTVPYAAKKIRLPWEVDEDALHENIEGQGLETALLDEMTTQFSLDLADLEYNGDETSGDPFLKINTGVRKQVIDAATAGRIIDGSTINGGVFTKEHLFAMARAMPNKYRQQGGMKWYMSPNRALDWLEYLTDRATAAGDAALTGQGQVAKSPLFWPIVEVPTMTDTDIMLAPPRNFIRVVTWEVRKRVVTGATDAQLAATDNRFYVFFIKHDIIVEELDAVVFLHTLDAI